MAEVLLVEPRGDGTWEALARPLRKLTPGTRLVASPGLEIEIGERLEGGRVVVRPIAAGTLEDALREVGEMPLPPYIRERSADPERYQTVYARTAGSAAAPTAGLHFTPELLQAVRDRCTVVEVDLRIGLDTFRPVLADDLDEHEMHSEAYAIDPGVRELLRGARAAGRRVVAVGTTATRVLETIADPAAPDVGRTRLKIQPGYRFALVDALVTNFHLPRSTLLALVMAFAGEAETRRLYEEAVRERYRFYSFGDAMLIT
jgi:S-adenosylmethionine:tRNA ribosyltransferase-isomerase